MENIIKKAFKRFTTNLLRYFLTYVISFGIAILGLVALGILAGVGIGVYYATGQSNVVGTVLGGVGLLGLAAIIAYLGSWSTLATTFAMVKDDLKDATDAFRQSKPLVMPFLVYGLLSTLFVCGLFYTSILLFIPIILWSIWGAFAVFAFIEGKKGGLMPLWYSKAKVTGNFWKVFGYLVLLNLSILFLSYLFTAVGKNGGSGLSALLWFLAAPFGLSFSYELYKSLPEPTEVKKSTGWIVVSVIGWVFIVISAVAMMATLPKTLENMDRKAIMRDVQKEMLKNSSSGVANPYERQMLNSGSQF